MLAIVRHETALQVSDRRRLSQSPAADGASQADDSDNLRDTAPVLHTGPSDTVLYRRTVRLAIDAALFLAG